MSHEDTRERARGSCRRPRQRGRHEFPCHAHRRRHEVAAANSARVLYGHAQPRRVGRREHARGGRLLFRARVMLLSTVDGVVWMPSSIQILPPGCLEQTMRHKSPARVPADRRALPLRHCHPIGVTIATSGTTRSRRPTASCHRRRAQRPHGTDYREAVERQTHSLSSVQNTASRSLDT